MMMAAGKNMNWRWYNRLENFWALHRRNIFLVSRFSGSLVLQIKIVEKKKLALYGITRAIGITDIGKPVVKA
jgi:hypothetical protein